MTIGQGYNAYDNACTYKGKSPNVYGNKLQNRLRKKRQNRYVIETCHRTLATKVTDLNGDAIANCSYTREIRAGFFLRPSRIEPSSCWVVSDL
jgi:hypothetical protein